MSGRRLFQLGLLLISFSAILFWQFPVAAQETKGTITGRVTDVGKDPLQGASVTLQPKGYTVVADAQGQFTISDLAPGEYSLAISYLGLAPFSTSVTVTAGEVKHVDAVL